MLGAAVAWRQGQSYSEDLRSRVFSAVDGGMSARAAAALLRVSVSYIYKALIRAAGPARGAPVRDGGTGRAS